MLKNTAWAGLRNEILDRIKPDREEMKTVEEFRERTERALTRSLRDSGLKAVAEVHGSVARDTWLSDERDVDVFIVLDDGYDREVFTRVLDVVKEYVGEGWVEAYAEHPYIRVEADGFDVEFIPCFRVEPGRGLFSSTDRTPLHTKFVNVHLTLEGKDNVRLLKRFMKGIGVYGAEIKVGGFSGYLCELLIIYYGSFEALLERAASWRRGEVVELTGSVDVRALRKRFKEPLIVPDPVDFERNVASAVSDTSLWTFTAAARAFLKESEERFFYPEEVSVNSQDLLDEIRGRSSDLLFVVVEDGEEEVPDILWGQLYKTEKAITNLLSKKDFTVLRSAVWSDESSRHILFFELEATFLPGAVKRMGPPVEMAESCERFLGAHLGAEGTVSGPWIEGSRWWVEVKRTEPDARLLVNKMLEDGGRSIGVSSGLGEKIRRSHRVLLGDEVSEVLTPDFAFFLDRFLKGRPAWLE